MAGYEVSVNPEDRSGYEKDPSGDDWLAHGLAHGLAHQTKHYRATRLASFGKEGGQRWPDHDS